jgi:hypothetical protein
LAGEIMQLLIAGDKAVYMDKQKLGVSKERDYKKESSFK